jgi:ABC-type uncharacterized transport system permease subunit
MLMNALGVLAILGYLAAALVLIWPALAARLNPTTCPRLAQILLAGALVAHGVVLTHLTFTPQGFNVSVVSAGSLVAWCSAGALLVLWLRRPLESLAVVILPLAAFALGLDMVLPTTHVLAESLPPGLRIHIALAVAAYSLFAIAALQAIFIALAEHKLRQRHPILHFLPPLPTMENVMFQLTLLAFVLLTLSLLLGALFIENIRAQHLAHKIVFSVLAWGVFATLVVGRWRYGWRGRHGVKFVSAGFVLLALAYFGTKVVLELILHRS